MPIRKLPPLLVNQIAAGEVIERPASVVKELVENSLDAGARRIDVQIEEGGRELIRVSDDGGGIPPEELSLAVAPHATSKLQEAGQLAAIGTLGFRGEALASMASVSRLRITSRTTVAGRAVEAAAVIEASGADVGAVAPAAAAPGTVIEVRDLFFNTPARRKFMRAGPTEFGHISEILTRIAMVRPDVAFTLSHGGRKSLDLPAGQSRRERCLAVLGNELDEALLEFEHTDLTPEIGTEPASVWGLAGVPSIARATGKFQYLCLNGRPIRDRNLAHAVREAYRGLLPPDRQPVAVVFVTCDPAAVDVNVHPAKAEVRFRDSSKFHGLVLTSMRQRLLGADLTPKAGITPAMSGWSFADNDAAPAAPAGEAGQPWSTPASAQTATSAAPTSNLSASSFVDYFRTMDRSQRGFVYEQVKAAMKDESSAVPAEASPGVAASAWEQAQLNADRPAEPAPLLRSMGVLQVHKSYLVTQDEQGLVIIDQHALHERVMFEELYQRLLGPGKRLESQRLLMPAVVNVSPRRMALLEALRPLLERIGVEAEPIGPQAVGVQAFPCLLFERGVEPAEFLTELLDKAQEGELDFSQTQGEEAALHKVLDMMACKAAVKAGDQMTPEELASLLAKREQIERSSNCPHGRPTAIRMTLRDLEKQFKRA